MLLKGFVFGEVFDCGFRFNLVGFFVSLDTWVL